MKLSKTERETKREYLNKEYFTLAATKNFIFGRKKNGMIYAVMVENITENLLYFVTELDTTSKGEYRLKFRPNDSQWYKLFCASSKMFELCTEEYFDKETKKYNNNAGYTFEALVIKKLQGQKTKNNLPFWLGGDMILNNIHWQIKYNGATVIEEKIR